MGRRVGAPGLCVCVSVCLCVCVCVFVCLCVCGCGCVGVLCCVSFLLVCLSIMTKMQTTTRARLKGAQALLQVSGIGRLRPNTLVLALGWATHASLDCARVLYICYLKVLGYKEDWHTSTKEEINGCTRRVAKLLQM